MLQEDEICRPDRYDDVDTRIQMLVCVCACVVAERKACVRFRQRCELQERGSQSTSYNCKGIRRKETGSLQMLKKRTDY